MVPPRAAALVSLFALAPLAAHAQQPPRPAIVWNNPDPQAPGILHQSLDSAAMKRAVGYNVALPPGYESGSQRYPVVYFLHGAGGNENSDAAAFAGMVRREIEARAIPPVICVFPNGGLSGYRDRGDDRVETYLIKELIPRIDSQYRTIAARSGRAVCGFSMGGGGSVRLALKYPDLFSAAASWAAAMGPGGDAPDSAAALARTDAAGRVKLLMVVGDKDMTFASHEPVVRALEARKANFRYKVLPDIGHDLGAYHRQTGSELVRFVAGGLGAPAAGPERWEPDIRKFEDADRLAMPRPGAVVFVGSSSIRMWKSLETDFPDVPVLNRGFGGSEIADSTAFAGRIVTRYRPRMIVLYAGDNDLAAGKTPDQVADDFAAFVARVRRDLPTVPIAFLAIKPSPARLALLEAARVANARIQEIIAREPGLTYIDVFTPMLGADGKPRAELFGPDRLHMNPSGYVLWRGIVAPYLPRTRVPAFAP